MRRLGCLLAVGSVFLSSQAQQQKFSNARDFAILCSTQNKEDQSFCVGYVTALIEASPRYGPRGVCAQASSPGVNAAIAMAGFEYIISIEPRLVDTESTSNIMKSVLMTAFPCEVPVQ